MSYSEEGARPWKQIAMELMTETDYERFEELASELNTALAAQHLGYQGQALSAENNPFLSLGTSPANAYEKIVDVAVALMRSDYASLQMLFPERGPSGELRLLAFRGFNPEAARFWEWVRADSKSTCGMALRDTRRVIAPDIAHCDFMADSEDQQVYLQTGILACQTTPLISRSGDVIGMISTHWRTLHHPSEEDLRAFDILARQAADLIDVAGERSIN